MENIFQLLIKFLFNIQNLKKKKIGQLMETFNKS